jgi:hypothetical protein
VNIHDGTTHSLEKLTVPIVVQSFEMVFQQYHGHREAKRPAPDGSRCRRDTAGLLKRYPGTATSFHLIGKETERGWEQNDDVSTLMPSLVRYGSDAGVADEQLGKRPLPGIRNWIESAYDRASTKRATSTPAIIATS